MIKFYYLPDEGPEAPCVLCGGATKNRAGYSPPGVKVERAVCATCYRQGAKLFMLVSKLIRLGENGSR